MEISQNFVAFSEYMNFNKKCYDERTHHYEFFFIKLFVKKRIMKRVGWNFQLLEILVELLMKKFGSLE